MPTYQYTCTDCEQPLEVVQGFNDDRLTVCPACGGRLRQVFSAVGVVFKGSGFYRNDSRSGSGKSGGETKSTGGDSKPAGDTKGDSSSTAASSGSSESSAPAKSDTPAAPASTPAPTGGGDKVA